MEQQPAAGASLNRGRPVAAWPGFENRRLAQQRATKAEADVQILKISPLRRQFNDIRVPPQAEQHALYRSITSARAAELEQLIVELSTADLYTSMYARRTTGLSPFKGEIFQLSLADGPVGTETVTMVQNGQTRRGALGALVSTLAAPHVSAAQLARYEAADLVLSRNVFIDTTVAAATVAGEAAMGEGTTFKAIGTDDGLAEIRLRTGIGSDLLYAELTQGALASPTGAGRVMFRQPGASYTRSVLSKVQDTVSVKDFGAVGDGFEHPLSEFYPSLAAAQLVYPKATSLSNLVDGLAIQAAIDAVESTAGVFGRGRVYVPTGRYRGNTGSIEIPNFVEVSGDGPDLTIIDNQNTIADYPIFVNRNGGSLLKIAIRRLSIHGGTIAFKCTITDEVNGLAMEWVNCRLQTAKNLEFNKLLQLSQFAYCVFSDAPVGVDCLAFTTNAVEFYSCSWEGNSGQSLRLRSAEGVNVIGGRFELGGNESGRATIDLDDAKAVRFAGVYFERTHPTLLRETNSRNGVSFDGCHFTGSSLDGGATWKPYGFESDGIVNFTGSNNWGKEAIGDVSRAAIVGLGGDRIGKSTTAQIFASTRSRKDILSQQKAIPAGLQVNLVRFQRAGVSDDPKNLQQVAGVLTVNFAGITHGGEDRCVIKRFLVRVVSVGLAPIQATISEEPNAITAGGADVRVESQAGAFSTDMMLIATFSGIDPMSWTVGNVNFRWESIAHSTSDDNFFQIRMQ